MINDKNNYDNFLTPEIVEDIKYSDKQKIINITKYGKKGLWKPMKLRLNKVVRDEIGRLLSNTA
jgi:hypothetical protein